MRIKYTSFMDFLKTHNAEVRQYAPSCPKHLDTVCMRMAGKCKDGDAQRCSQWCSFYIDKGFYSVNVIFVVAPNSTEGFIDTERMAFKNLVLRGILSDADIDTMRLV